MIQMLSFLKKGYNWVNSLIMNSENDLLEAVNTMLRERRRTVIPF